MSETFATSDRSKDRARNVDRPQNWHWGLRERIATLFRNRFKLVSVPPSSPSFLRSYRQFISITVLISRRFAHAGALYYRFRFISRLGSCDGGGERRRAGTRGIPASESPRRLQNDGRLFEFPFSRSEKGGVRLYGCPFRVGIAVGRQTFRKNDSIVRNIIPRPVDRRMVSPLPCKISFHG